MPDEKKPNVINDVVSKLKDAANSDAIKNAAGTIRDVVTSDKVKSAVTNIASNIKPKKNDATPAIEKCPACQHQVSNTALKCPNCGHQLRKLQRTLMGKISKWAFILFNLWMIYLFLDLGGQDKMSDAAKGLGAVVLLPLWAMGDLILGLFVLFTKPKA